MRRNPLISIVLMASLIGIAGCEKGPVPAAGPGGPPGALQVPVEAVTVQPQALEAGLSTVGSLRADESVVVRPEVAGRISRIHFTEGGRVEAGQALFTLDGSLAQASLNEASANLQNSQRIAARAGELVGEKLIARADYDTARAALGVDQARVASARAALAKMTLRAPFSGQIGLREVSVGDFVGVGQDLVTLVRIDPIGVDFSVPESAIAQLQLGQRVILTVDAYPGETFFGEVVAIDPVVDPNSRSARLRARVPNPDSRLRPGQFAKLQVEPSGDAASASALLLPEQALMQEGDVRFVYTVVDGKAKKTPVTTGRRVPGQVQALAGIKAGDVVITAGQAKPMMRDGVEVMVLPAADAIAPDIKPEPAKPDPVKPSPANSAPAKPAPAAAI